MQDGREFHSGLVDGGLRFPPVGWDETRMADKFRWLAGYVLPPNNVEEILELSRCIDRLASVAELTDRLAPRREVR